MICFWKHQKYCTKIQSTILWNRASGNTLREKFSFYNCLLLSVLWQCNHSLISWGLQTETETLETIYIYFWKHSVVIVCLASQIRACCSIGWYFNPERAKVLAGMLVHCMCSSICWYVSPEHADVCLLSQTRAFQSYLNYYIVFWIHSVVIVCLVSQIRAFCIIGWYFKPERAAVLARLSNQSVLKHWLVC